LAHWEDLRRAGYTPKQLEDVAESGENFDRIMKDAFIEESIPPECKDWVKKLKREASIYRFPVAIMGLSDARDAVETAVKRLPKTQAGSSSEFLPGTEGKIKLYFRPKRRLAVAEIAAIEASRDLALEKIFSMSPGASDKRDENTVFPMLQDSCYIPDYLKGHVHVLEPWETEIRNAIARDD